MRRILVIFAVALLIPVLLPGSERAATVPPAPAGVTGIALNGGVQLAWQPAAGATGYTIYRGTSAGSITTALSAVGGITGTTYTDTTAQNGTTYYYAVRSATSGVESLNSLVVQAKPVGQSCTSGNAVVLENCYPGNTPWNVRNTAQISAGGIEGYATAQSINKGDSLPIKVNAANGATFNIEIYRSGYYGGAGARLFSVIRNVPAVSQPACVSDSTTGLYDCANWSVSATITTTAAWPTGIYLLRIVRQDTGTDNQIMFVVRDDSSHSDVLYGTAMSAFEAYNNYGGKSLYTFNSNGSVTVSGTPRAVKVSFDRPFEQPRSGLRDWYTNTEFATVYWLEQMGYDVSYVSNTDLETSPGTVLNHKAYISPAHDEYVSAGMRSALENARDHGVNLFFTGSNEVYWKIRFENSPTTGAAMRTEVCYKTVESGGPDPSGISTSTWRDPNGPNDPENALSGEMYVGDNDTTYFPFVVTAAQGTDRIYRYTPLSTQTPGTSTSIGQNLVGWEWDARVANGFEPAGVKTLSGSPVTGNLIQGNGHNETPGSATVSMVKYTAASGALVLTTGTNHWNRGLALNAFGVGEPDQRIQQITTNLLEDMGAAPQTPPSDITLDSPQANRPPAPASVTAVASGADSVQVSWSAVPNATGYNVYRALAQRQGGQPLGALANPQLITGTTFTDTGLASATTYYYVVTAVVAGVQSVASTEAQALTAALAGQPTRINAGGPDYTSSTGATYRADAFFTGGSVNSTAKTITGTNDPALYQDERWGQFSYSIPVANGVYDVRFHFAELFYPAPCAGKRVFSMDILETPVSPDLANIDICKAVGPNAAYDLTVSRVTVTGGTLDIKSVYGSADDPEITAIDVIPDQISPSVTATNPVNGAKDIPISIAPTASFSEAIDPTTLTASSFTLTGPGGVTVPTNVSYDSTTNTATLTPRANLAYGTTYTATLAATIKAVDGTPLAAPVTWSFTTHQPHPPGVVATFPAGGATGVSPGVSLTASFDQPIDPTTLTSASFSLATSTGATVPAVVSYDSTTQTASLVPQQPLATATTYTATLSPTITSATGIALAGAVSWSFGTASTPPAPPTVTSSTPAAAATSVSEATTVQATFSRDMYGSSISSSTFTLSGPGGQVSASAAYDSPSRTATLTPSSPLTPSTTYTVRIAASVAAADGTPLGTAVSWNFTTSPPPTITATSPNDGAAYVSRTGALTVTFSRAMNTSTITSSSLTVAAPVGSPAPASVTYDPTTNTATITPTSPLSGGTTYTATVNQTAQAADGAALAQPYTWTFTTAACPCTIFSDILQPTQTGLSTQDGRPGAGPFSYEFGTKFTVDEPMQLTAFRFFKSSGETGTHIGKLWTANGVLLAQQTFTTETASGWQQQALATPVTLQSNTVYIVSVNANSFFVSTLGGLATQTISGPMRTIADGANGAFANAAGQFPTQTYSSSNYFVDAYTVPAGDPGSPGVIATTPAAGAIATATTTAVTAQFSRSIDPSTVTTSTFQLVGPSGPVAATVSYDDTTATARLTPSAALSPSTAYTATLTTGIRARDGMPLASTVQWTFTTVTPAPPQVIRTVPTSGATDATTSSTVSVVFSKSMDPSTVTSSTFTLTGPGGAVAGTVSYNDPSLTATLTPSAPLTAGATYTATVAASVASTDHATLATPYIWSFTVASGTLPPPSVVSTSPLSGATGVSRSPSITATFSRSLDPATVTNSSVTLTGPGSSTVASTVSYNDSTRTVTLTPNSQLAGSTAYTVTVSTAVTAIDGTPMSAPATWTFTTAACPCSLFSVVTTPASVSLSTADGRSGTGPFTYEMGVKVTATQNMQLTAIRFYKSPGETGTHVGHIWTSGGVLLASATFANETTSGWQQQALSSPLAMTANTVYVVSVNANSFFVMTGSALAAQVTSGPLQSVADGANGVFGASAGTFPTSTYSSSNYFVDLVASPAPPPPPSVSATSPANGGTGADVLTPITATFSRSMDTTSITGTTFTLTGPSGSVAATVTYDPTSNTAKLTPSAPLAFSSTYTARIDPAVRASDGTTLTSAFSWSFTTAAGVAPQVTNVVPALGETDVNTGVVVKADFSKPLNGTTVNTSTFTLTGPSGAVPGTVAYNATANEASFTPATALAPGTYTATLAATVAATDTAQLGTAYTWSFTVPATPVPLTVSASTPAAGATNVARDSSVTATFSRPVTASSVNGSSFTLTGPAGRRCGDRHLRRTRQHGHPHTRCTVHGGDDLHGSAQQRDP